MSKHYTIKKNPHNIRMVRKKIEGSTSKHKETTLLLKIKKWPKMARPNSPDTPDLVVWHPKRGFYSFFCAFQQETWSLMTFHVFLHLVFIKMEVLYEIVS